jgi:hypothetical protein
LKGIAGGYRAFPAGKRVYMEREESDQLPEEGPAEQVPDDAGGDSRDDAERNEPGDEDRATGHPDESDD